MSSGIDLREDVLADVGIGGVEDVRGLACAEALEYVVEQRRVADAAEARVLAAAVHWIDLHPVTAQNPPAGTRSRAALLVQVDGRVEEPPLAGPGTPGVAEFAVEELAAALGISYHSCLRLVSEAVELCVRLPRLWALVLQPAAGVASPGRCPGDRRTLAGVGGLRGPSRGGRGCEEPCPDSRQAS
jgi:hypothetical protein